MMLNDIIKQLFESERPMAVRLKRGLMLVINPGKSFKAGRKGAPVGTHEITVLEGCARQAGHVLGQHRTYDTDDGWNVVEWTLTLTPAQASASASASPSAPTQGDLITRNPYQFD